MALQGTLDTFALPDVLRLLAATAKSGCLRVTGGRGGGEIWFDGGAVSAARTTASLPTTDPVEVLCDLLRCTEGDFVFEAGAEAPEDVAAAPADVEPLLVEAEQLVSEWHEIEQVVPSLDCWISLVDELPKAKVSVDGASWKVIVALAGGATVRDIGAWMGVGELGACRAVRTLIGLGLATAGDPPVATGPEAVYDPFESTSPFARAPESGVAAETGGDPETAGAWDHTPPWADESQWVDDPGYLSFTPERQPAPAYQEIADPDPAFTDGPHSLAEALPEVPEAVPADLQAGLPEVDTDDAEVDAYVDADEIDEEEPIDADPAPIDRSRLLKFLGSVGK